MSNSNTIDEEAYRKKQTYSDEEKKIIMDRLNQKRLAEQKKSTYSKSEKNKILKELNEQRLSKQRREEMEKRRTQNKEVYDFSSRKFYKFLHMDREYYIELSDIDKITSRPSIITLYYRTFGELKKKDVLIKAEMYSDKFLVSHNAIRVHFNSYSLETMRNKS